MPLCPGIRPESDCRVDSMTHRVPGPVRSVARSSPTTPSPQPARPAARGREPPPRTPRHLATRRTPAHRHPAETRSTSVGDPPPRGKRLFRRGPAGLPDAGRRRGGPYEWPRAMAGPADGGRDLSGLRRAVPGLRPLRADGRGPGSVRGCGSKPRHRALLIFLRRFVPAAAPRRERGARHRAVSPRHPLRAAPADHRPGPLHRRRPGPPAAPRAAPAAPPLPAHGRHPPPVSPRERST